MTTAKLPVDAWVDGACTYNPGPAGFGIVLVSGRHRKEISGYLGRGTNNVAELAAAIVALRAIRDPDRPVRILTDSSYVRGLLALGWKPKANRALVGALRAAAARFPRLEVVQVPGHAGVPGNERADALARKAITRGAPVVSVRELIDERSTATPARRSASGATTGRQRRDRPSRERCTTRLPGPGSCPFVSATRRTSARRRRPR